MVRLAHTEQVMEVAEHGHAPEDVMAYVDGELPVERVAAVEAHLAECRSCRELVQELRETSAKMATWRVEPAPLTLRVPSAAEPRTLWRMLWPRRVAAWQLAVVPVVLALAGVWIRQLSVAHPIQLEGAAKPESVEALDSSVLPPSPSAAPAAGDVGFGGWYPQRTPGKQAPSGQAQLRQQGQASRSASAAEAQREQRPTSQPQIARTATLRVIAADFDTVRSAVERIVADA